MTRTLARLTLAVLLCLWGCQGAPSPDAADTPADPPTPAETEIAAETSEILPQPFTAEEICAEWVEGLTLTMKDRTPEGETLQRWTVVAADGESVEIEFAELDAEGGVTGEPVVGRSTCVELRDHAAFPASTASRKEETRETALGTLDGWVYTVPDAEAGTVTEFFFARSTPGAPVEMRVSKGGETVGELVQVERSRPE